MLHRTIPAALLAFSALVPVLAVQDSKALPQRFTATAVSLGGPRTASGTSRVDITIDRWTTSEERKRLMSVLKERGPDGLLEELRSLKPVGRISTPGNVGYDLHYAQQDQTEEGGRRIVVATDRPISHWEAVNQPRVSNYPFTFVEMRLDEKGHGEGKLSLATQINFAGNVLELVNYAAQPMALTNVRQESN